MKPTRKVTSAGVGGAAGIVVVWAAGLAGLEVPPEVAAAIVTLLSFGLGYLTPERDA